MEARQQDSAICCWQDGRITSGTLSLEIPVARYIDLKLGYEHINANSNLNASDFNENIFSIGFSAHY